ncbi:MAG: S8/S53 family peptidase [Pseudomonadota bacterium]
MRRVLIVLDHEEALVRSATASSSVNMTDEAGEDSGLNAQEFAQAPDFNATRRIARESRQAADLPRDVLIDDTFAAVPIGDASSRAQGTASADPQQSGEFAVRATVTESVFQEGFVAGKPVFADPDISPVATCGGDPAIGNAQGVMQLHNVAPVHQRGLDGDRVAIAIMDTGVSARHLNDQGLSNVVDRSVVWNPIEMIARQGRIIPPGGHQPGHGTMCAFDALIAAPKAKILDYPIISNLGGDQGGSTMSGALSDALKAFSDLEAFWAVTFSGTRQNYDSLVVNNSWGLFHPSWDFPSGHPGRYLDNPNHPFNVRVTALARHNVDILFAAGNCGSQCPDGRCGGKTTDTITGANAHPDVLTLAGVDVNGGRIGYSSEGPPVAGMGAPNKPDIAAATHFNGSGVSSVDSGTSASCPVASGCVAALRTALPQNTLNPATLFDALRQNTPEARAGQSWNGETGFGILDLDAAAADLSV